MKRWLGGNINEGRNGSGTEMGNKATTRTVRAITPITSPCNRQRKGDFQRHILTRYVCCSMPAAHPAAANLGPGQSVRLYRGRKFLCVCGESYSHGLVISHRKWTSFPRAHRGYIHGTVLKITVSFSSILDS